MLHETSGRTVVMRDSEIIEAVDGNDIESLTRSMGRALAILSHEMADAMSVEGLAVKGSNEDNQVMNRNPCRPSP